MSTTTSEPARVISCDILIVKMRYSDAASYGIRRCEFDHYLLERSKARLEPGWISVSRH
jgi:hypothetical protein